MSFKSLLSPLALAAVLAMGAVPAFSEDAAVPMDISKLTAAERTQLEDQCRMMQTDTDEQDGTTADTNSEDQMENEGVGSKIVATAEICAEIGLGEQ